MHLAISKNILPRLSCAAALLFGTVSAFPCPTVMSTSLWTGHSIDLAFSNGTLVAGGDSLIVFSLENPDTLERHSSVALTTPCLALEELSGNSSLVSLHASELRFWSSSETGVLSQTWQIAIEDSGTTIHANDGLLALALESGQVRVIGTQSADALQGPPLQLTAPIHDLYLHRGYLWVSSAQSLSCWAISSELALEEVVTLNLDNDLSVLSANGSLLTVKGDTEGTHVFDISLPAEPQELTIVNSYINMFHTRGLTFAGNDLLMIGRYIFDVDLAWPGSPVVVGLQPTLQQGGTTLVINGNRAYALSDMDSGNNSGLQVLDIACDNNQIPAMDISPAVSEFVGINGDTLNVILRIANRGDTDLHCSLTVESGTWPTTLIDLQTEQPLQDIPVLEVADGFAFGAQISVPEDPEFFNDQIRIRLSSEEDPANPVFSELNLTSSCRSIRLLPEDMTQDSLAQQIFSGACWSSTSTSWLISNPAAILVTDSNTGAEITRHELQSEHLRGLAWQESRQNYWSTRNGNLLQLAETGDVLATLAFTQLEETDAQSVAGMAVDQSQNRLWVLQDLSGSQDRLLRFDLSNSASPVLEGISELVWNADASGGCVGLAHNALNNLLLSMTAQTLELECFSDLGNGQVEGRGDYCPTGLPRGMPLALSPAGVVQLPVQREQAFTRVREYQIPCVFTVLNENQSAANPRQFMLRSWPNPFNPSTQIQFALPHAAHVTLGVYNLQGHLVQQLQQGTMPSGQHQLQWTPQGIASGVYLLNLQIEGSGAVEYQTKRILYLK